MFCPSSYLCLPYLDAWLVSAVYLLLNQPRNESIEVLYNGLHSSNTETSSLSLLVKLLSFGLNCRQRLRLLVIVRHEVLHKRSECNQATALCIDSNGAPLIQGEAMIAHN